MNSFSKEHPLYILGVIILMATGDVYYVAYNLIIFLYISFIFIRIKFRSYHSSVMFLKKSMSIYND